MEELVVADQVTIKQTLEMDECADQTKWPSGLGRVIVPYRCISKTRNLNQHDVTSIMAWPKVTMSTVP